MNARKIERDLVVPHPALVAWQWRFVRRVLCPLLGGAWLVALLSGCSSGPTLHPVEGKIEVDGKPLPSGSIVLYPDAARGNKSTDLPTGKIEGGKYRVTTKDQDGAAPGWYKLTVNSSDAPADSSKATAKVVNRVGPTFRDVASTKLSIEVVAAPQAGAYDLKVSAK